MEYKELLAKRRSIRDYLDKKVPLEILQEIIKDACYAPSACNGQPWRFIIIQNKDLIKRISDENKNYYLDEFKKDPHQFFKKFESLFQNPEYNIFYNASTLVMICGKRGLSHFWKEDCTLATAYFMFAATERQLATCFIGWGAHILNQQLRKEIGLTEDIEVVAPIIVGYPKTISTTAKRNEPIILKTI